MIPFYAPLPNDKMRRHVVMVFLIFGAAACTNPAANEQRMREEAEDLAAEATIDSAYPHLTAACETLMVHRLPVMVDSVLQLPAAQADSSALLWEQGMVQDTTIPPNATKAEKVIRQIQWDCYTNLLRETYKRARQLRQKGQAPLPVLKP